MGTVARDVTMAEIVVCEGTPAMNLKLLLALIHNALATPFDLTEWGRLGLVQ